MDYCSSCCWSMLCLPCGLCNVACFERPCKFKYMSIQYHISAPQAAGGLSTLMNNTRSVCLNTRPVIPSRTFSMSPPSSSRASKRRPGRKRLPPLAPPPAIQFVVANHPNQFRDGSTMRNVRSHVMYRHREQRGPSPSDRSGSAEGSKTAMSTTRTPSPMTTNSDGLLGDGSSPSNFLAPPMARQPTTTWDSVYYRYASEHTTNPSRSLATRIITAITAAPARSAPPMFEEASQFPFPGQAILQQESMETLKHRYIQSTEFYCHDPAYMQLVCDNRRTFLSHVSVACVYQDLNEGALYDSELTLYAKMEALSASKSWFDTDDASILSITHLLISELGGPNDDVVNVHAQGLVQMVTQRGGISKLHSNTATTIALVSLSFSVLRGTPEPLITHGFAPHPAASSSEVNIEPISPLYAPRGELSQLYGLCSTPTIELLSDVHALTQVYLIKRGYIHSSEAGAIAQVRSCETQMQQLYHRLLARRPTTDELLPDWIYETCRLASLIYANSIVFGSSFVHSGNIAPTPRSELEQNPRNWLTALHTALIQTNTSDCWNNLRGVFLWVCLVGGAASWPIPRHMGFEHNEGLDPERALARKRFALMAIKASVSVSLDQAGAMIHALRTILHIRQAIEGGEVVMG